MPIFLQHSVTLTPSSTCFKAKVICSSVNAGRRTGNLDSQAPSTLMNGPGKREEVTLRIVQWLRNGFLEPLYLARRLKMARRGKRGSPQEAPVVTHDQLVLEDLPFPFVHYPSPGVF